MTSDPERDLDAALREALRVEPAPEFLPRVRERLRNETPAARLGWLPAALLAGAALGVVVMFARQPSDNRATASVPDGVAAHPAPPSTLAAPKLTTPPMLAATVAPVRREPRPPAEPEVLVPDGQEAAIARFAWGLEALDQENNLAKALTRSTTALADLRIEPLSIEPLERNGT